MLFFFVIGASGLSGGATVPITVVVTVVITLTLATIAAAAVIVIVVVTRLGRTSSAHISAGISRRREVTADFLD